MPDPCLFSLNTFKITGLSFLFKKCCLNLDGSTSSIILATSGFLNISFLFFNISFSLFSIVSFCICPSSPTLAILILSLPSTISIPIIFPIFCCRFDCDLLLLGCCG